MALNGDFEAGQAASTYFNRPHFASPDRETVVERLALGDQAGLILQVCWEHRDNALRLAPGIENIDDRNIRWRKLFQEDHALAVSEGVQSRNWVIEIDEAGIIQGFPRQLKIKQWRVTAPDPVDLRVEVVPEWGPIQQRSAQVEAAAFLLAWRLPQDDEKTLALLTLVANLREGDILTLRKPDNIWARFLKPESDLYPYWAEGGVPIDICPETLSLLAWTTDRKPTNLDGRRVRVASVRRGSPRDIECVEGMDEVLRPDRHTNELHGVLTSLPGSGSAFNPCTICWLVDGRIVPQAVEIRRLVDLSGDDGCRGPCLLRPVPVRRLSHPRRQSDRGEQQPRAEGADAVEPLQGVERLERSRARADRERDAC